jgi:hypothetical protein
MLLVERFFRSFTTKELADTARGGGHHRAVRDQPVARRRTGRQGAGGGRGPSKEPCDFGWMYGRSFQDLDRHLWEVFWMDPAGPPKA